MLKPPVFLTLIAISYFALVSSSIYALASIIFYLALRKSSPVQLVWGFMLDLNSSYPFGFFTLLCLTLIMLSNLAKTYIKEKNSKSLAFKIIVLWLVTFVLISTIYIISSATDKIYLLKLAFNNSFPMLILLILFYVFYYGFRTFIDGKRIY